ncbi:MAG: dihydrodipicolinate reductase C-terminal domain-containing protein [Bryobacteraceae bacterium]
MKLAIVGYGKMGRMVEQFAPEFGFTVHSKIDANDSLSNAKGADVAIEFSAPDAALGNIEGLAALGIPTVTGTTGWLQEMDRVKAAVTKNNSSLIWSANFSVGVNVLLRAVHEVARLLANESGYEAWAWEIHHSAKKDAPSGTLLALVREMQAAGYTRTVDQSSNRAGKIAGTHEIGFDSAEDTITLRHTARTREGFARGALRAAQLIQGKKGVFEFKDLLG